MRRIIILMTAAVLALLASAAPALAIPPERTRLGPVEFTIFGACPFGVHYHELRVSAHATTFFDRHGEPSKAIINGNWVVRLTNIETEESLRLNISGQFYFRDRFIAHGRNLLFHVFPEPLMVLAVGNADIDLSGGLTVSRSRGRLIDVCGILAP
jgi:hypothetical protein